MDRLVALDLAACRALQRRTGEWAQSTFALISRLGDGWLWAAVALAVAIAGGDEALPTVLGIHPFAARVLQLLDDPHLRAQVGVAGRAHVREHWSAAACAKRLAGLYADVVYTGAPISSGSAAASPVPLSASAVATASRVRTTGT